MITLFKTSPRHRIATVIVLAILFTWSVNCLRLYFDEPHIASWFVWTSGDTTGSASSSPGIPGELEYTVQRLQKAEENWERFQEKRRKAVEAVKLVNGVDVNQAQILWDIFPPVFDCPLLMERIGRVGDGGKWICGFDQLEVKLKCVVLSFGVSSDTSFEEEIIQRTPNCTVHMFDPTISSAPSIVERYPGRAFFRFIGIGGANAGNIVTLKTILDEIGVKSVDVLKVDVEGAEWESVRNILEDFPERLPFAQLLIEVHLHKFKEGDWLGNLTTWFESLESAGLRQFFQEPNLFYPERFVFRELAFLNTKTPPFELEKVETSSLKSF